MAIIERNIQNSSNAPQFAFINFLRMLGVILIIVGIYFGYQVINYSWKLLEDPQPIAAFSEKIENYSKINANLKNFFTNGVTLKMNQVGNSQPMQAVLGGQSHIEFNVSYFAAWGALPFSYYWQ